MEILTLQLCLTGLCFILVDAINKLTAEVKQIRIAVESFVYDDEEETPEP
ncbi:MAG TPA: hypothetical protein VF747_10240 [Blastocatellia bacterium]|jgi:hypothetical protein